MSREDCGYRTVYRSYVIDDGWHLPQEVVEAIDLRIQTARKDAYKMVCLENSRHRGGWLDFEVARKYSAMSWVWRVLEGGQYIGKVRELGEELQREYGVTELEAINILNGYNVYDYVNKYERIRNRIPIAVDEQEICNDVAGEYLGVAM